VPQIHRTAIVEDGAELATDVVVGAYAYVGSQVRLGPGCVVANHAIIQGRTRVGEQNQFHPGSAIGGTPQDLKYHGEPSELVIGNNNVFREHCTVHIGTADGGMLTSIGNNNLFMASTHVAHDCRIGNRVILANLATLGGHVVIDDGARIAGIAAVHQFVRVGCNAFIRGLSGVVQDIPPFMIAAATPARVRALNIEGLKRSGLDREQINALKEAFRLLYRSDLNRTQAIREIQQSPCADLKQVQMLVTFLIKSEQGHLGRSEDRRRQPPPASTPPKAEEQSETKSKDQKTELAESQDDDEAKKPDTGEAAD
jgi:UDP-N-acetylglucosamine acyltransferase